MTAEALLSPPFGAGAAAARAGADARESPSALDARCAPPITAR